MRWRWYGLGVAVYLPTPFLPEPGTEFTRYMAGADLVSIPPPAPPNHRPSLSRNTDRTTRRRAGFLGRDTRDAVVAAAAAAVPSGQATSCLIVRPCHFPP